MSLVVRVDAESYYPAAKGFIQTVTARSIWGKGTRTNVILDTYTGVLMCEPIQFRNDWETLGTVTRYPKASWTGDTSHWDDLLNSAENGNGLLNSDYGAGKITTSETFALNTSFLVSFLLCGTDNDRTSGIDLEFGQWKLNISTSGNATLSRGGVTRYTDIISDPIPDTLVEFIIMPYVNNSLLIRRINGGNSGMLVSFNSTDDTVELGTSPASIITAATFSVTPKSVAVKQFSLTELTYNLSLDYELISPVLDCVWPPTAAQTFYSTDDGLTNYGGGVAVALWEEASDVAFAADGVKHKYRTAFIMTPLAHKTPMTRGLTFAFEPIERTALTEPADISTDIRSYTINADQDASQTEAIIELRNPATYGLFGTCSRLCTIVIDGTVILNGVMSEPPVYTRTENGEEYYSIRIQGLYRYLQRATIKNPVFLDNLNHAYAVQSLCYAAGLAPTDITVDATTDLIPNTVKVSDNSGASSDWQIKPFDLVDRWIKRICNETGWVLTDGLTSGVYNLKYVDPLAMTATPVWTYHFDSAYETAYNQKIHTWSVYSEEPACNLFHLVFCNENGERCDAIYYDADSADGTLEIGSRPDNWMGFVVEGGFDVGVRSEAEGQALSLRIGEDLARRIDMARFSAEWPVGLWANDVVTVANDGVESHNYRIKSISIKGVCEITGIVFRVCDILAEKIS